MVIPPGITAATGKQLALWMLGAETYFPGEDVVNDMLLLTLHYLEWFGHFSHPSVTLRWV